MDESWNVFSGVNLLVSSLIAIPLSILANIMTPRVEGWFAKRSLKVSRGRLSKLKEEQAEMEWYVSNLSRVYLTVMRIVLWQIAWIGVVVLVLACSLAGLIYGENRGAESAWRFFQIGSAITAVFLMWIALKVTRTGIWMLRIIHWDEYKKKLQDRIEELESKHDRSESRE